MEYRTEYYVHQSHQSPFFSFVDFFSIDFVYKSRYKEKKFFFLFLLLVPIVPPPSVVQSVFNNLDLNTREKSVRLSLHAATPPCPTKP